MLQFELPGSFKHASHATNSSPVLSCIKRLIILVIIVGIKTTITAAANFLAISKAAFIAVSAEPLAITVQIVKKDFTITTIATIIFTINKKRLMG